MDILQRVSCRVTLLGKSSLLMTLQSLRLHKSFIILTQETTYTNMYQAKDNDCGVCNWTWRKFEQGKGDRPLFVISNRCIPVKNTLDW